MEQLQKFFLVALLLVTISGRVSNAQVICNMTVKDLLECKPSVTPPRPTPPTARCCSAVSRADFRCLCGYKNSKLLPTLGVDPNLAIQLLAKCKLPVRQC